MLGFIPKGPKGWTHKGRGVVLLSTAALHPLFRSLPSSLSLLSSKMGIKGHCAAFCLRGCNAGVPSMKPFFFSS